jgi:hypothetical protein
MWARPIYDAAVVERLLGHMKEHSDLYKTTKRITGMVTALSEELPDCPLFVSLPHICSTVHLTTPPLALYRYPLTVPICLTITLVMRYALLATVSQRRTPTPRH